MSDVSEEDLAKTSDIDSVTESVSSSHSTKKKQYKHLKKTASEARITNTKLTSSKSELQIDGIMKHRSLEVNDSFPKINAKLSSGESNNEMRIHGEFREPNESHKSSTFEGIHKFRFGSHEKKHQMRMMPELEVLEQNKSDLRSGSHNTIIKPLSTSKIKRIKDFRCPPFQNLSLETLVSESNVSTHKRLSSGRENLKESVERNDYKSYVEPNASLLANLLPNYVITPVTNLFQESCKKIPLSFQLLDKSNDKSITQILLRAYSNPSGNVGLRHLDLESYDVSLNLFSIPTFAVV